MKIIDIWEDEARKSWLIYEHSHSISIFAKLSSGYRFIWLEARERSNGSFDFLQMKWKQTKEVDPIEYTKTPDGDVEEKKILSPTRWQMKMFINPPGWLGTNETTELIKQVIAR